MAISITGTSATSAQRIERWVADALARLGRPDEDIRIEVWGMPFSQAPDGREAGGGEDGIQLHRSLLGFLASDVRLGWILHEEVAHVVLSRAGTPPGATGGLSAFFQECFATWAQFEAMVSTSRISASAVNTWAVKPEQSYYELGKHLGAALAGSRANAQHLRDWAGRPYADPSKVALVAWAKERLTAPLTVEQVTAAYRARTGRIR